MSASPLSPGAAPPDDDGYAALRATLDKLAVGRGIDVMPILQPAQPGTVQMVHPLLHYDYTDDGFDEADGQTGGQPSNAVIAWMRTGLDHIERRQRRQEEMKAAAGRRVKDAKPPDWSLLVHPLMALARQVGPKTSFGMSIEHDLLVGAAHIVRDPVIVTVSSRPERTFTSVIAEFPDTVAAAAGGRRLIDVTRMPTSGDAALDAAVAALEISHAAAIPAQIGPGASSSATPAMLRLWLRPAHWRPLAPIPQGVRTSWHKTNPLVA